MTFRKHSIGSTLPAGKATLAVGLLLAAAGVLRAQQVVLPNEYAEQRGAVGSDTPLSNIPAVFQSVFSSSNLTAVPPGSLITGIAWRRVGASTSSWPPDPVVVGEYNIQVSTSLNPPGSLSMTFDDNIAPDVVLARGGPLEFAAGSFPANPDPTAYAQFGPVVEFTTPFEYWGGDLLITVRRTGYITGSGSTMYDALTAAVPGWGALFQGHQSTPDMMAAVSGASFSNRVFIYEITYEAPSQPCYANCDSSTTPPILNVDDFTCFINEFAGAQTLSHEQQIAHYANCDNSTTAPVLNVDDFTCFINAFATGCP